MKEQAAENTRFVSESVVNVMGGVTQVLEYYDLAPNQIRVYLRLAKAGPQKATDVATMVGIHRTEAYQCLYELEARGLASRSLGTPSLYTALSFREAVNLLWQERKRVMDSMQLMGDVLAAAFERMPRGAEKKAAPFTFTRHKSNGLLRAKVEDLSSRSSRRLYYLEDSASRHLEQVLEPLPIANAGHPELGSFLVFDDSVFIMRREPRGGWGALEIRMPEIVAAYAELYRLLEGEP